MARSLNKVQLIGNLAKDPELRYTPNGNAVCTFTLATNRSWTTESGEKKEEADFHRIVAWNKLAELCSQFLVKGRKVYVEGRLSTRSWTGQDGQQKYMTEVVIDDMILLDSKTAGSATVQPPQQSHPVRQNTTQASQGQSQQGTNDAIPEQENTDTVAPDDIPF